MRVAVGRARFTSGVTQDAEQLGFAVLHFGDHNVHAGVRPHAGESAYKALVKGLLQNFENADIAGVIRITDQNFGAQTYSLKDLLKDEQRKIMTEILKPIVEEDEGAYRRLYDSHAPTLRFLHANYIPIPKEMAAAAEYALNGRLRHALEQDEPDFDRIRDLLEEIRIAGVKLDQPTLEFTLRRNLERKSDKFFENPLDIAALEHFTQVMTNAKPLPLQLSLWSIQNRCYEALLKLFPEMRKRAAAGDEAARNWTSQFSQLAESVSLLVPE